MVTNACRGRATTCIICCTIVESGPYSRFLKLARTYLSHHVVLFEQCAARIDFASTVRKHILSPTPMHTTDYKNQTSRQLTLLQRSHPCKWNPSRFQWTLRWMKGIIPVNGYWSEFLPIPGRQASGGRLTTIKTLSKYQYVQHQTKKHVTRRTWCSRCDIWRASTRAEIECSACCAMK